MSTGRFNNVSAASIWEHLAFFLGYLTIAVVLLAPMSLSPANRLADDGDSLQGLWIIWWGSSHLFRELGQLFDANSYYPHPLGLAYSEPMLTEAILVWPLFEAISNRVLAINVLTFLSLASAAFACHLLVRELTESRMAAFVAALFYAFNSYVLSHLAQLQLVSVQWIPLALFFLHRSCTRSQARYALAFAATITLLGLSSFYYLAFFSIALAIVLPAYLFSCRAWRHLRQLGLLAAGGLVSAIIVFVVASRYQELFERYGFTGEPATLDLWAFFEPPPGSLLFDDLAPYRLTSYFLGYVAVGLGIWGVFSLIRDRKTATSGAPLIVWLAFALTGILAFFLAAGPHLWIQGRYVGVGPFELLRMAAPFERLREPARMAVLVYLALAVFLGRGVAQLFGRLSRQKQVVCALLVGGLVVAEQWSPRRTQGMEIPTGDALPSAYEWLRDYPEAGAVAELPVRRFHEIRKTSLEAYFSTFHERPILFSKPSFYPPAMELLQWELRDFPDERSLHLLRALDVRLALVHPKRWETNRRFRMRRLDRFGDAMTLLSTFEDRSDPLWAHYQLGGERLYRVASEGEGRDDLGLPRECHCREIDRSTFRLEANGVTSPELAIDGDRLTKWTTGEGQREGYFFEIAFDRPQRPVRVEIEVAFPYGEFARNLEMNGYRGQRGYRVTQIEDLPYKAELMRQLVERPTEARLRYDLEPMPMERLRLFIHRTERGTIGWSIPEIHVYEQRETAR